MTTDPPDPTLSKAMAAYRSTGNLRKPQPAPQIVRLVEQHGQQQAIQETPAPKQPSGPKTGAAPGDSSPVTCPSAGVSLMITGAQKDSLRRLGVSEEEIRDMTPTEAHRRLGLSDR